jgi:multidrug efflux pump
VFVEISQKRLAQLGLDFNHVIAQLAAQNAVENPGVLNAGVQNLQVRIGGQFDSVQALRAFPIRGVNAATGAASTIRLADIAEVRRGYADPPGVKVRHEGRDVVAIGVSMRCAR